MSDLEHLKSVAASAVEKAYILGYDEDVKEHAATSEENFKRGADFAWGLARRVFSDERISQAYNATPREVLFKHSAFCVSDTCVSIDSETSEASSEAHNYDELLTKITETVAQLISEFKDSEK